MTKYTAELSNRLEELNLPDSDLLTEASIAQQFYAVFGEYPTQVLKMSKPDIADIAQGAQDSKLTTPCIICGKVPFWYPAPGPLLPGHIYSKQGMAENRISRLCEYCFDQITAEPDPPVHADNEH